VEFEIKFLGSDGPADLEITLAGAPTPATLLELNARLGGDPQFHAGITMLVDLTALDASGLTDSAVQRLSEPAVERDWYQMPAAVAIIAPTDQTYVAARSYRAHLGGSKSNRHVFRSRSEAVAWLEEQKR
jgi:hypothetical protein